MTYFYNNSNNFEGSENDMVNSPAHYKLDGLDIESKDVLKSVLGNRAMFTGLAVMLWNIYLGGKRKMVLKI